MSVASSIRTQAKPAETAPGRHRFSADDFEHMVGTGLFHPESRVELIAGEVLDKAPPGDGHTWALGWLQRAFRTVEDRFFISNQSGLRLNDGSVVVPDLVLIPLERAKRRGALPGPDDAALVIEVADASLRFDQQIKAPLYAEAGIAEYWIVDVRSKAVLVHREPESGRYATLVTRRADDTLTPLALPDLTIHVRDLLG